MALYGVMLVDDEEAVRQAIASKLEWEKIGFEVIATAENGEEALELAEKLRPDVVMTDIKMPFMDGLTLCHKLKERQRDTRIVIFSGFDEFEYAREAIKLEVEEYILKPIDSEELENVFLRIKKNLDAEIDEKRNHEKLYEYYQKSLPVMKEQFMAGLMEGKLSGELIEEMNSSYEVNLNAPYYAVTVFCADMGTLDTENRSLLKLSLKQIVDENMKKSADVRSFLYFDMVAAILLLNGMAELNKQVQEIDQVCKAAKRLLGINVTAGVGQAVAHLGNLAASYQNAVDAADYRVLLEQNQAIYIRDIQPAVNRDFVLEDQDIQKVMRAVKLGTREEVKASVDEMMSRFKTSNISLHRYQVALMELLTEFLKLGRSYHLDLEEIFGGNMDFYRQIAKFDSLDSLGEWLYHVCMKFRSLIRQEQTDSAKLLAGKAEQFIKENYAESSLSVEMLCGHLNVSAAYFSTIFKRETGQSFVMYLTHVRMEAALELLNNTQDKTYVIAGKVGYTEPNYFSYVFRKQYGMSPTKYRMSKMENHETEG